MIPSLHRSDVGGYSPFGTVLEERNWSDESYRYGFNGKEKEDEGMGGGCQTYDYGFRVYNPALARFLSVDPLLKSYAWNSPYSFAENDVIRGVDLDGLEYYFAGDGSLLGHISGSSEIRVVTASNINPKRYPTIDSYPPFSNTNKQWYERNSTALHAHHSSVISAVFTTIFRTEFKDDRTVDVYSDHYSEGAHHTHDSEIGINRNFTGELATNPSQISNYYNVKAMLAHEKLHDTYGGDYFSHFKISKMVYTDHVKGKAVTPEYKRYIQLEMKQYVDGMATWLANELDGAHSDKYSAEEKKEKADNFNAYRKEYENAVDFYNREYKTDVKSMDYETYEKKNHSGEESVIAK